MSKTLVAYFSATGTTARAAERLAKAIGADLHEIRPKVPYTKKDLDWTDPRSRSTLEMKDKSSRPEIEGRVENMDQYDTIYVGFPIWWYVAPTIVNTFLESYDLSGKTVIPFATSSSSGMGQSGTLLANMAGTGDWQEGHRFSSGASTSDVESWVNGLGL